MAIIFLFLVCLPFASCQESKLSPHEASKKDFVGKKPEDIIISDDIAGRSAAPYIQDHFDPDHIGFIVYDIGTEEVLFSHNRNRPFIPASTLKTITILNALDILGHNYRIKTRLATDGIITDNTIEGNLYLVGGGDPSLSVSDIIDMVNRLKMMGITHITESFHYDYSAITQKQILDTTMGLDRSYNTGVSALSLENNYVDARWFNNAGNGTLDVFITPDLPMFEARPSKKEPDELCNHITFQYLREKNNCVWELSPDANDRGSMRLPVRRTPLYTAQLFTYIARIHGIDIPWPSNGVLPGRSTDLIVVEGDRLTDIAALTMKYSLNIYAELLFLTSAKELFGEKSTYTESGRVMELYAKKKFSSIDWGGFTIVNGSGLSSRNRITPEQMLAYLIYANSRTFGGKSLSYFMQPSGWNHSLRNRFYRSYGAYRVYAKTGTIHYGVGLSGYIHTQSGRHLLFVFFNSNEYLRYLHEQNDKRYGDKAVRQARQWNHAFRTAMDSIVEKWILTL